MDEKESSSSPSTDPHQNRNDTISADDTLDAPSTGRATDGGWAFVTQAHYDPHESRDLATVIVSAIAEAEGVPIVEVKNPTLYEIVDIAGIDDALFGRPEANRNGTESSVEFRYNGYKVGVEADGWVTVSNRSTESATDDE